DQVVVEHDRVVLRPEVGDAVRGDGILDVECVAPGAAGEDVEAVAAGEPVVAHAAEDPLAAELAPERVVAAGAADGAAIARSPDLVAAGRADLDEGAVPEEV